jgi:hypothetical protein
LRQAANYSAQVKLDAAALGTVEIVRVSVMEPGLMGGTIELSYSRADKS